MMTEREIIMLDCHLSTKRRDDKTNGRSIIISCCIYVVYIVTLRVITVQVLEQ